MKVIIPRTYNLGFKKRVLKTGIKEENIIIIDKNKVKEPLLTKNPWNFWAKNTNEKDDKTKKIN